LETRRTARHRTCGGRRGPSRAVINLLQQRRTRRREVRPAEHAADQRDQRAAARDSAIENSAPLATNTPNLEAALIIIIHERTGANVFQQHSQEQENLQGSLCVSLFGLRRHCIIVRAEVAAMV
jgi:hypothetical protein